MTGIHCATCTCAPTSENVRAWADAPLDSSGFCPANADIGAGKPLSEHSSIVVGRQHIDCLTKGHHTGPHEDRIITPCVECGAWDEHADWCKTCEVEYAEWERKRAAGEPIAPDSYPHVLRFEMDGPGDEPTYWIVPKEAVQIGSSGGSDV